MPEATLDAFDQHGVVSRTADADLDGAARVLDDLAAVGVDLHDVTRVLEEEGVASFQDAFRELLSSLETKAADLRSGV